MCIDIPILKKCCCCIPVRNGLVWAYLRMVYLSILVFSLAWLTLSGEDEHIFGRSQDLSNVFFIIICVTVSIFNVILLIAVHQKSYELLKLYYSYDVGYLVIISIVISAWIVYDWIWLSDYLKRLDHYLLAYLGLCAYNTLLVRSELKRLESERVRSSSVNLLAEERPEIDHDETQL